MLDEKDPDTSYGFEYENGRMIPSPPPPTHVVLRVATDHPKNLALFEIGKQLGFEAHRVHGLSELVGFLCYQTHAPSLICLDHQMMKSENMDVERVIETLKTLMWIRFPNESYKIAIRLERDLLDKNEVKHFKNLGVCGLILSAGRFGYHMNTKSYQEILYGPGEFWPKEAVISSPGVKIKTSDSSGIALTERQQQVKRLLCERGLSNKAIARHLNISESTVKIHVSAILKRYAVRNRTQLALAVKNSARL